MSATATPMKRKYRLLSSLHYEPDPNFAIKVREHGANKLDPARLKMYKKGEIIESERNLEEVFPNKFKVLTEEELAPPIDLEARRRDVDRLIQGGTWTEEDRAFLERLTDENFKRLTNRFSEAVTARSVEGKAMSVLGEDVTHEFQVAYDSDFKVFKSAAGLFQVTTKANTRKPLNKEPLKADKVNAFVSDYLKEK